MLQRYKNCGFSKQENRHISPDKVHLHQVGAYMPVFNVMLCRTMSRRLYNYDSRSAQSLQSQISVASPS